MNPILQQSLRCPICSARMQADETGRSCRCLGARSHSYDFSASGYLNLTRPGGGEGDTKAAIQARRRFLSEGYYQPLSDAINALLEEHGAGVVLDAGCGEGYYTGRMAAGRDVIGLDLSRAGVDAAAKAARAQRSAASFVVGNLFDLPFCDGAFDAVVNIFAPCAEAEFLRVLRPGGLLLLAGAGERHLFGLKQLLYRDPYLNPGRADLPGEMSLVSQHRLTADIRVMGRERVADLFSMTPYYWRTSEEDRAKLSAVECLETEIDFDIFLYRKGDQ